MTISVRAYRPADRGAVREICFETGYMGDPVVSQWADQPSFANLFTSYYTDHEPESALVAVDDEDDVVGYLLGCRDSERAISTTRVFLVQLLTRGLAFRPGTARFIRRAIVDTINDLVRHETPPDRFIDPRWPAHLHINLLPAARGHGVGAELVRQWLQTLERDGAAGCHLETLAENTGAIALFTSCGFAPFGPPKGAPGLRAPDGTRHHVQVMVRALDRPSVLGKST